LFWSASFITDSSCQALEIHSSFNIALGMKDLLWEKIVQLNRATLAGLASRIISLWEDNDS